MNPDEEARREVMRDRIVAWLGTPRAKTSFIEGFLGITSVAAQSAQERFQRELDEELATDIIECYYCAAQFDTTEARDEHEETCD